MLMTEKQSKAVERRLTEIMDAEPALYDAWKAVGEAIEKAISEATDSSCGADLDEVWNDFLNQSSKPEMVIQPIIFGEKHGVNSGKSGYQLLAEDKETMEFNFVQQVPITALGEGRKLVPVEFLESIQQQAYCGYTLMQSKIWKAKTV